MKKLLIVISLLGICSCATIKVQYDYEKNTNFSNYSTYHYYYNIDTGLSELDDKRLFRAVDSVLQSKGFLLSEEPDFLVNITSMSFSSPRQNTVGLGVGGGGGAMGGGVSVGLPLGGTKEEKQFQFDFIDSQKESLFWQAISISNYKEEGTPAAREKQLQEIVSKVFAKYPPKK